MPKVSQEYRDARREEILDAARRCFLREGFHETSMQDLFAEAGMSAGAVYRYFKSKDEMIVAIAEENMRDIGTLLSSIADEPHADGIAAALAAVFDVIRARHRDYDFGSLALLVWSEALRNPTLAAKLAAAVNEIRSGFTKVVRVHQSAGLLPADANPRAVAGLLMSIMPGYMLQLSLFGPKAVAGLPEAARALWPA